MRLYQKHNMPTNEIIQKDLRYYTALLLEDAPKGAPEEAITMLKQLHQTYSDDLFVLYVNKSDYLQYVVDTSQNLYQKLCLIWTYIGPYLRPGSQSQHLFRRSIQAWEQLCQNAPPLEANKLFALIKNAIGDRELEWLQILVDAATPLPGMIIERFYWQLVSDLSIEQREAYRIIVQPIVPTIVEFEVAKDLAASFIQSKLAVIGQWVAYATKHPGIKDATSIVSEGLDFRAGAV